jgi:hypothetical protein
VTQRNRSGRERRTSCADGEVCSSLVLKKRKKLLTRPASLEIRRLPGLDDYFREADEPGTITGMMEAREGLKAASGRC